VWATTSQESIGERSQCGGGCGWYGVTCHWLASFRTLKWIVHSRSSWEPRKDGRGVPLCAKTRLAEGERGTGGERVPTSRRSRHAVRGEVPVSTGAADLMGRRLPLRTACLGWLAGVPSRYETCPLSAIRLTSSPASTDFTSVAARLTGHRLPATGDSSPASTDFTSVAARLTGYRLPATGDSSPASTDRTSVERGTSPVNVAVQS